MKYSKSKMYEAMMLGKLAEVQKLLTKFPDKVNDRLKVSSWLMLSFTLDSHKNT